MLETVDWIRAAYGAELFYFEVFSVIIFTVEYVARVWSAVEAGQFDHPITGRLKFASHPLMVIDLLPILPFYLSGVMAVDLRFLRALRLIRLIRMFKLARYSESLRSFGRVLEREKEKLAVAGFVNLLLLVVAASVMYQAEHQAQPEVFSSIPAALWWGVVTLTTVGYGDVHPVTPVGQFFGAIVAVLGIGLFALPASILASGFIAEATGEETRCPHCGELIDGTE